MAENTTSQPANKKAGSIGSQGVDKQLESGGQLLECPVSQKDYLSPSFLKKQIGGGYVLFVASLVYSGYCMILPALFAYLVFSR